MPATYTFGAVDILSLLGITAAEFEIQDSQPADAQQRAVAMRSRLGIFQTDLVGAIEDKTVYNLRLKAKQVIATSPAFDIGGAGTGGVVVTGVRVRQMWNDFAEVSIDAHTHTAATVHQATPAAVAFPSIVGVGFGVLIAFGVLALPDECQSLEWAIETDHVDRYTKAGAAICGATTGFRQTVNCEAVDNGSALAAAAGWTIESQALGSQNQDFKTRTARLVKYGL